jgi:hypothetical protein
MIDNYIDLGFKNRGLIFKEKKKESLLSHGVEKSSKRVDIKK